MEGNIILLRQMYLQGRGSKLTTLAPEEANIRKHVQRYGTNKRKIYMLVPRIIPPTSHLNTIIITAVVAHIYSCLMCARQSKEIASHRPDLGHILLCRSAAQRQLPRTAARGQRGLYSHWPNNLSGLLSRPLFFLCTIQCLSSES